MRRALPLKLSLSATLGLLAAGGAYAAPVSGMDGGMGMSMPPPSAPTPSNGQVPSTADDASRIPRRSDTSTSSGLLVGMTVKDSSGATVGKITRVGQSGGAPAALVDVDGKTVILLGSTLRVSGNSATSTQTKDEIAASPQPRRS